MGCIFSCSKQSSRRVNNTADPVNSARSTAEILPAGVESQIAAADSSASEQQNNTRFLKSPLRIFPPPSSSASHLLSINKRRMKTPTPEIVNHSSDRIVVCEKHRDVWGRELYSIGPGESVTVQPTLMAGTFVWMEIVSIWGDKRLRARPPICIDSDELPSVQRFVISGQGSRLILERVPADR